MPTVERDEGARISYELTGSGPLVVVTTQVFAHPGVQLGLVEELASDHRVLTYDPRGTGGSSSEGPFDNRTDGADLLALIRAAGGPAAIIGLGNACEAAVVAAAQAPELVLGVVVPFGNPAGFLAAKRSEALMGSISVLAAMNEMLANDYRAGLRSVISSGNPQMSDEEIRERVDRQADYCPAEVAIARMASWRRDGVIDEARSLGARLWVLQHPHNPWFPADMIEATRELLPEARIEEIEDGHLSRPDLTAEVVRRITAAR